MLDLISYSVRDNLFRISHISQSCDKKVCSFWSSCLFALLVWYISFCRDLIRQRHDQLWQTEKTDYSDIIVRGTKHCVCTTEHDRR